MVTVANRFHLPGCLQAAAAIEADLTHLVAGLTEAQFQAPPRTGGWSVGHCIEHLVLTGQAFLPKWDTALLQAAVIQGLGSQSFQYPWWQRRLLQYAENPSRFRQKTAPPFVPCCRRSSAETLERFLAMHQDLVRRINRCCGVDVGRVKVQSPFVSWIRYALGFSFDLVLAHERRHLYQAWRVQRQLMYESG